MRMVYAVGAITGPMLASWATRAAGVDLLFPYIAVVYVGFAAVVVFRMRVRPPLPPAERKDFVSTPGTSPAINAMAPSAYSDPGGPDAGGGGDAWAAAEDHLGTFPARRAPLSRDTPTH